MLKQDRTTKVIFYTPRMAKRNGKFDGKLGIPAVDQTELARFEKELMYAAEENIVRIGLDLTGLKGKFRGIVKSAYKLYEKALREANKTDAVYEKCCEQFGLAQLNLKKLFGAVYLKPSLYFLVLFSIGIFEIPVNTIVFEIFGESMLLTIIMTVGLAFCIPFLGHILGILLRNKAQSSKQPVMESRLTMALAITIFLTLMAVAYIRGDYFKATNEPAQISMSITPLEGTGVFFIINLLLFAAATTASYCAHDPEAQGLWFEYKVAKNKLGIISRELKRTTKNLQVTYRQFIALAEKYKALCDQKRMEAFLVQKKALGIRMTYQKWNIRTRKDHQVPKCFSFPLPICISRIFFRNDEGFWTKDQN